MKIYTEILPYSTWWCCIHTSSAALNRGSELEVEFIVTVLSDGEEDSATLSEGVTLVFASFLEPLEEPVPHIERYGKSTAAVQPRLTAPL